MERSRRARVKSTASATTDSVREAVAAEMAKRRKPRKKPTIPAEMTVKAPEKASEASREPGAPLHRTSGAKTHTRAEIAALEAAHGLVFREWMEIDLWTRIPVFARAHKNKRSASPQPFVGMLFLFP